MKKRSNKGQIFNETIKIQKCSYWKSSLLFKFCQNKPKKVLIISTFEKATWPTSRKYFQKRPNGKHAR